MKFGFWDHAGKGAYLIQRLVEAGHTPTNDLDDCDLLLLDCDWRWAVPRLTLIEAAHERGVKIVLYPHGGHPTTFVYDGLTIPDPRVSLRLEHGPGPLQAADNLGLELQQKSVGWLFSPTAPFQQQAHCKTVLFAPQHPQMEALINRTNGHDPAPSLNQHIYRKLLKTGYRIVVSMVGPAYRNGVWPHPNARFVDNPSMNFQQSYLNVLDADVVVGAGTIGVLGVALGKPTVMFGQGDFTDYVDGQYKEPDHVEIYSDAFRYPLDADDADLDYQIAQACYGTPETAEWRRQFVGDDGTAEAVYLLEGLVGESSATQSIIPGEGLVKIDVNRLKKTKPEPEPEVKHVAIQGVTARATAAGKE